MNLNGNFADKLKNSGKGLFRKFRKILDKYSEFAIYFELASANYILAIILTISDWPIFAPLLAYNGTDAIKHAYKIYRYKKESGYYDYVDRMYKEI